MRTTTYEKNRKRNQSSTSPARRLVARRPTYREGAKQPPDPIRRKKRGVNSRQKGKRGELLFRDVLRDFGYAAKRGQQRSGVEESDVVGGPSDVHFEVKFVELLNVWAAYEQAQRDARGRTPVVAMKRKRTEWLAVCDMRWLLELLDHRLTT